MAPSSSSRRHSLKELKLHLRLGVTLPLMAGGAGRGALLPRCCGRPVLWVAVSAACCGNEWLTTPKLLAGAG